MCVYESLGQSTTGTGLKSGQVRSAAASVQHVVHNTFSTPLYRLTVYPAHEDHQLYLDKNPGGYCNHSIRFLWSEQ